MPLTFDVKIGDVRYPLERDPAHVHPPVVHAHLATNLWTDDEFHVRRLLDALEADDWYEADGTYKGRDPFGIGVPQRAMTSTLFWNVLIAVNGTPVDAYKLLKETLQKDGISFTTDAYDELAENGDILQSGDTSALSTEREQPWLPWPKGPSDGD